MLRTGALAGLLLAGATGPAPVAADGPASPSRAVPVRIENRNGAFVLLRGGEVLTLRGAVVDDATAVPGARTAPPAEGLAGLAAAGANAARVASRRESLDAAHAHGLVAVVDLGLEGQRDGLDWSDDARVAAQAKRVLARVAELRDHPAIVAWALGNEIDYMPPNEPYHPLVWKRLNDLAKAVKALDPNHLVLTILGDSYFEQKVKELAVEGTAFDLLGLNGYGALARTTAILRQHWPKPYVVTEWGPTGHWEVPRTLWGAPIEETSSEKAAAIDARYREVILGDPARCLGSFVFFWGEKQETTHTWYGLLHGGRRTTSIDVMERNWRGKPPSNLAPQIVAFELGGSPDKRGRVLKPGAACEARLVALDVEGDSLAYAWDVRPEVVIPEGNYAGRKETRAPVLSTLVRRNGEPVVRFVTPEAEGAYRLFVTVSDGRGSIAYANFPFFVSKSGTYERSADRHL